MGVKKPGPLKNETVFCSQRHDFLKRFLTFPDIRIPAIPLANRSKLEGSGTGGLGGGGLGGEGDGPGGMNGMTGIRGRKGSQAGKVMAAAGGATGGAK